MSEAAMDLAHKQHNPADGLASLTGLDAQLENLQQHLCAVQTELEELRQRDRTLRFYTERLDQELKLAARVQRDFLPRKLPRVGNVSFHAIYKPAGFVSGDLYDVMRLDESHVGLYVADAVGHGMPAALLTMFLKNALVTKEILAEGYRLLDPSQALERLNEALVAQNLSNATFATAAYARVDATNLQLTLARGGHPCPLRLSRTGDLSALEVEGSLLGIFGGERFPQITVQLEPGDRVFVFSDGVEVAFAPETSLDSTPWLTAILAHQHLATAELVEALAGKIDAGGPLKDDLTLVVMEVE